MKPSWTTNSTLILPSSAAGHLRFTRDFLAAATPRSRPGPVVKPSQAPTGFEPGTIAPIKLQMMSRAATDLSRVAIRQGLARAGPLAARASEITPSPGKHPRRVEPTFAEMHRPLEGLIWLVVGQREGSLQRRAPQMTHTIRFQAMILCRIRPWALPARTRKEPARTAGARLQ